MTSEHAEQQATFFKEVAFDIETTGTTADSGILSIAAVNFDIRTGAIGHIFYSTVKINGQPRYVDQNTLNWWKKQNPLLKKEAFSGTKELVDVLTELHKFIKPSQNVWGNGANFDTAILEHAYKHQSSFNAPWKFWNGYDMRTITRLAKELTGYNHKEIVFVGRKHHAVDDAVHQAKTIHLCYHALNSHTKVQEPE